METVSRKKMNPASWYKMWWRAGFVRFYLARRGSTLVWHSNPNASFLSAWVGYLAFISVCETSGFRFMSFIKRNQEYFHNKPLLENNGNHWNTIYEILGKLLRNKGNSWCNFKLLWGILYTVPRKWEGKTCTVTI